MGFDIQIFGRGSWGCHLLRTGFPLRAFECAVEYWDNFRGTRVQRVHYGKPIPGWVAIESWDRKYLPTRVIWRGVVINTAVWSAMVWAALTLLRYIRLKRNL